MRPKAIHFLLPMLLLGSYLSAQVPGYLGRKNIIRIDENFFPSFGSKNYIISYAGTQGFTLKTTSGLGYERVISRRHVVGAEADFTPFGVGNTYVTPHIGRVAATALGIGIHLKAYPFLRKGWLAPLGPYVSFAFKMLRVNAIFVPDANPSQTSKHESHLGLSSAVTFGYSSLIRGRLLLDFGLRLAFSDLLYLGGNAHSSEDAHNLYKTDILKAHIGIGFLF